MSEAEMVYASILNWVGIGVLAIIIGAIMGVSVTVIITKFCMLTLIMFAAGVVIGLIIAICNTIAEKIEEHRENKKDKTNPIPAA